MSTVTLNLSLSRVNKGMLTVVFFLLLLFIYLFIYSSLNRVRRREVKTLLTQIVNNRLTDH